jgi:hypothetical protein
MSLWLFNLERRTMMNKLFKNTSKLIAAAALIGVSSLSFAAADSSVATPQYNFLPQDQVVDNVKANLQNHGISTDAIDIQADAQGVVKINGDVTSKTSAEKITRLAMHSDGVYAVLASLQYPDPTNTDQPAVD